MRRSFLNVFACILCVAVYAQKTATKNLVYVDNKGVLRYTKDNTEAAFFGVNYTVPFAYGYRSHKALGVDPEKAIDEDVHDMARLGLDAFRVHVWDVEISDSLGNLLDNEHLRLFDYLLAQLEKNNIKILITPIAFWGNGYPERDQRTNGFSYVYGKGNAVVNDDAIKAQENYLQQFFAHVNPYTKQTYTQDINVIGVEINNEPHHSGPKEKTTEYINRLATAIRSTGWTKPVFYNISESPWYADAVAKANVDGHSFQWYPSGLVANHEQKGNFLPNVDQYNIPFIDTVPEFLNRARMVYEFDAADIMQPIMYPAMARSYRTAGFQWATQFAYDPVATAYGNTEYQTHYLNLVYTPSKAISLLIASKAFHKLLRNKSYGAYPADTSFDVFRVSYAEQLSEMNSDDEFYYSNSTSTKPKNVSAIKHVAGVGSSQLVSYTGTGAYFLDKIGKGLWRLEVMPDVIPIRDPFERASPKKEVTHIEYRSQLIHVALPDLGRGFSITPVAEANTVRNIGKGSFIVRPGVYFLASVTSKADIPDERAQPLIITKISEPEPFVYHTAFNEVSAGHSFIIKAIITEVDSTDKISVEAHNSSNKWKTIVMHHISDYEYQAEVPAEIVTPGVVNYRIIVQKQDTGFYTFPGGFKGNPYAWDEYRNETWQTFIAPAESQITLFDPNSDRTHVNFYNSDWRNNSTEYVTADKPGQLIMKIMMNKPAAGKFMGWQFYFSDKVKGRVSEISSATKLVLRVRAIDGPAQVKAGFITSDAQVFASNITVGDEFINIEIPLSSLVKDSLLLLPRPFPGFLPLWFQSQSSAPFNISDAEKLQITFDAKSEKPIGIEIESIWLKK